MPCFRRSWWSFCFTWNNFVARMGGSDDKKMFHVKRSVDNGMER